MNDASQSLSRRQFLRRSSFGAAGALALPGLVGLTAKGAPRLPAERPNILWLCPDQQRYDTVGALNNPYIRTPNLDRLVARGAAFTQAYCQSPVCTPSRASFLTGRYPSTVHACINGNAYWEDAAPLVTRTLAASGYTGGLAGKLHLSSAQDRIEPRPDDGYSAFYWSHHPWDTWPEGGHEYNEWLEAQGVSFRALYRENGYIPAELHQTTWCASRAIDFIERNAEGPPWFFSFNCFDPHSPFDPPPEYVERFDIERLPGPLFRPSDLEQQERLAPVGYKGEIKPPSAYDAKEMQARYWGQIELIDENLGRMLDALEATGQLGNTLILYTSDHGDMVGDHGLLHKGCRFYDGLVRVPLLISWPARFQQGLRAEGLTELTDLAPTLLEVAGLDVPKDMQGRSLVPVLTGEKPSAEHRRYARSEFYDAQEAPEGYGTMLRDARFKLVVYHGHDLGELYDMQEDPGEFVNLWDDPDYADVRFRLLKASLDEAAFAVDRGPERVGRY